MQSFCSGRPRLRQHLSASSGEEVNFIYSSSERGFTREAPFVLRRKAKCVTALEALGPKEFG